MSRQEFSRVARQASAKVTWLIASALAGSTAESRKKADATRKMIATGGSSMESATPYISIPQAASNQFHGNIGIIIQPQLTSDTSKKNGMKRKTNPSSLK